MYPREKVCVCVCVREHVCLGVWDGLKCVLNSLRAHMWMPHLSQGVGMSECDLVCDRGLRGTVAVRLGEGRSLGACLSHWPESLAHPG